MTAEHRHSILPPDMISVEDARARILEHIRPLEPVTLPVLDCLGLVLAEDIVAGFDIPPLANTGMDGYALRAQDTAGATPQAPRRLAVIGYLAAGHTFERAIEPGQAVRIMTGAPIPPGADAVVPFEETDEQDRPATAARWQDAPRTEVRIDVAARPGANIRPAGEDVRAGEVVLARGTVLAPAQLGVLAALGRATAPVIRRPRVAILSTGDELLRPGEPLVPGKIYDANAFSLAAQVRAWGGEPAILDIARDTTEALTARLHEGLRNADLLVTSAGVSRGDFDVVKDVLQQEGEIGFWTVRMKPGKPLAFGTFRARPAEGGEGGEGGEGRVVPHLGLPGNPVSAMVTFELFGRPAVFTMLGKPRLWPRPTVRGIATERIENTDGRRFYARAQAAIEHGRWVARLTGPQGSGVLTSMALANAFAVCPEDVRAIEPGEECEIILLDREHTPAEVGTKVEEDAGVATA